jgi:hypothetical protein
VRDKAREHRRHRTPCSSLARTRARSGRRRCGAGPACQPEERGGRRDGLRHQHLGRPAIATHGQERRGTRLGQKERGGELAFGPKLRRILFLFPFLFLILQIHFQMQQHVCTSKYLTLLLILFIENYFSRLKCSQNCENKSNSPILK